MSESTNIIGIIPARYASTRLPAKPIVDICGKPMIQRVYEQARQSKLINRLIVATDDERIAVVVRKFGGEVTLTPLDIRSGSDRVAYVAGSLSEADIVVNVQGDEPLIVPEMIDQAIRPLVDDPSIPVGTLVKKIDSSGELLNPGIVKVVIDDGGFAMYFSRSPIPFARDVTRMEEWHGRHQYYKHIGLYVYRRSFLLEFAGWDESPLERAEKLEQLRILEHGYRIKAAVTTFDSIPVDTAEDVERVKTILQ